MTTIPRLVSDIHPTPVQSLTVLVPVMNEEGNLLDLYNALTPELEAIGLPYEILIVDDGSQDRSWDIVEELNAADPRVVGLRHRRNFGKAQGLSNGFAAARGDIVITMDGDLQDDPKEISRFLATLDEGYDLVSGWKQRRQDPLGKTFPSKIFNWTVRKSTGVQLHDFNCGFKAYRREVLDDVKLYGELHRFIPVLAHERGFRVTEVKVRHHKRQYGKSKFGARRFLRGFLDLIMVLFLKQYLQTPLRLFGAIGLFSTVAGILVDLYVVLDRFLPFGSHQEIHNRPLLFVGILLLIFGISFILTGLQSEMIRHFAYRPTDEYSIRQVLE